MSHPTATPDAVVEAYVATWNETDPARRRAGLAAAWTETGIYRDPVMASDGPAGIDAMLAGVQAKFPGFVLKRTSKVDAHGGSLGGPSGGPSAVGGSICASPGRWVRPTGPRSSRVSISAPWRRTGGWRRWSGSSTRCRVENTRDGCCIEGWQSIIPSDGLFE